jgi:hypothetical protein
METTFFLILKDASQIKQYNFLIFILYSLLLLYFSPVRHRLQNVATLLRLLTPYLYRLQWQLVAQCQYPILNYDQVTYEDFLQFQKLHNFHKRRIYFGALFWFLLIQISNFVRLFCTLLLLQLFLTIPETPPCLLLLTKLFIT